ncbi:CFC_HP_G0068270.mRNA.1.CDS.1 [Saccharomyces cerevisiae]|nr:CFC_HP_G0068270.mRNA.1.CDS.1 [Saccharomyces cerevisiae]CAI6648060.1 CFC_HP_G0068270.mRNA.1.CDS.1 [Saccharomyces cerevisiae]
MYFLRQDYKQTSDSKKYWSKKENMLTEFEKKIEIIIGRDLERKTLEENIKTPKVELNNKNEENCGK